MIFAKQVRGLALPMVRAWPVYAPVLMAAFGAVAMVLAVAGWLHNWLVWPLGLLAMWGAWRLLRGLPAVARPGSQREQRWGDIAAVIGVVVWGIWNIGMASEHVFTNRDPGTYANTAGWLQQHASLTIATPMVFGNASGLTVGSPGFLAPSGAVDAVHAQGQHLMPVLLGLLGRLVGDNLMLQLAPVFGMVGLWALYGFGRLIMRPYWALVATGVVAVSLPMLYFSRDTYTEPLSLACIFGALSLLYIAVATGRRAAWGLAGLLLGTAALARIDVFITIAGFVLFVAVWLALQTKADRRSSIRNVAVALVILLALAALALADTIFFSGPYFDKHKTLLAQQFAAFGVVLVVSAGLVWAAWQTSWLRRLNYKTKAKRQVIVVAVVLLLGVFFATRPWWQTFYTATQNGTVANIQLKEGHPVEPRSYIEYAGQWVGWYLGPLVATLGVLGLAIMGRQLFQRKKVYLLAPFLVIGITCVVYLTYPSIAADQIWASRRLLPVIFPGIILAAAFMLSRVTGIMAADSRVTRVGYLWFSGAMTALVLAYPLLVSKPFLLTRDSVQLPLMADMCPHLPQNAAVVWVGDGQFYAVQPTRSFCNKPAAAYVPRILVQKDLATAAQAAVKAGYVPVLATFGGDIPLLFSEADRPKLQRASEFTFNDMEMRLLGPPRQSEPKTFNIYLAQLQPDGTISELHP